MAAPPPRAPLGAPLLLLLLGLLRGGSGEGDGGPPRAGAASLLSAPPLEPPLSCHTDFEAWLVCEWGADCAPGDLRLRLSLLLPRRGPHRPAAERRAFCLPERGRCRCALELRLPRKKEGLRHVCFEWFLERRRPPEEEEEEGGPWSLLRNGSANAEDIVKPRPPVNVTGARSSRGSWLLSWTWDYLPGSALRGAKADYEVAYWPKGQPRKERSATTTQPTYEIFADHLTPASDYVARVRFRLEEWGNISSDWSPPFEWHNDFEPEKPPWELILGVCILLVSMISTGYLSFVRVKRGWWDQIPSPAKSKMAQSMMMFPLVKRFPCKAKPLLPGRSKGKDKDSWNKTTAAATLFWAPSGLVLPGPKPEVFLTPEVAMVERPLLIHSCVKLEGQKEEEGEEEEELVLSHQGVVAGLFQNLLNGDFSTGEARVLEAPAAKDQGALGGVVLGNPSLPPEASPDYQSSSMESVVPSLLESPTGPGDHPGQGSASSGSPLLPQRLAGSISASGFCPQVDGPSSTISSSSIALGYRSISSLVSQPGATSSHVGEGVKEATPHDLPHFGQMQLKGGHTRRLWGPPAEPQSTQGLSVEALGLACKQWGSPKQPPQVGPGKTGDFSCAAASLLPGYQSFASALQDGSSAKWCHGSSCDAFAHPLGPYKPLSLFQSSKGGGSIALEGSQA